MPTSRQAAKRCRTDEKRRMRNRSQLRRLRTAMRRTREASTEEEKQQAYRRAQSEIDRAGRKRVIHPNKAQRLKSRLQKEIQS